MLLVTMRFHVRSRFETFSREVNEMWWNSCNVPCGAIGDASVETQANDLLCWCRIDHFTRKLHSRNSGLKSTSSNHRLERKFSPAFFGEIFARFSAKHSMPRGHYTWCSASNGESSKRPTHSYTHKHTSSHMAKLRASQMASMDENHDICFVSNALNFLCVS